MKNKYKAGDWNSNLSLIMYVSIIMSAIGMGWLALNNISSGNKYTTLFLIFTSLLFVTFFFLKEDQKSTFKQMIKSPFSIDLDVSVGLYVLGVLIPLIISIILGIVGSGFNISQTMVPLATTEILNDISLTSFSVAETSSSPFWMMFVSVFVAGSLEEFGFGFVLMLVGGVIGMFLLRMFVGILKINNFDYASKGAMWFYTLTGFALSISLFVGSHKLNNSYVGIMFLIAMIFRFIMNSTIYLWGAVLTFTLGYHHSNNFIWFWNQYGVSFVLKAFNSVGGILVVSFIGLILLYFFSNFDVIIKKIVEVLNRKFGV